MDCVSHWNWYQIHFVIKNNPWFPVGKISIIISNIKTTTKNPITPHLLSKQFNRFIPASFDSIIFTSDTPLRAYKVGFSCGYYWSIRIGAGNSLTSSRVRATFPVLPFMIQYAQYISKWHVHQLDLLVKRLLRIYVCMLISYGSGRAFKCLGIQFF